MKLLLFLFALPFFIQTSFAQSKYSTHTRQVIQVGGMTSAEYGIRKAKKEEELFGLKKTYLKSAAPQKASVRAQMLAVLYELFDLNMIKQYAEARQLKSLLQQLEQEDAYQNKSSEIVNLKLKLAQVEKQIADRKSLRDKIVSQRLQELISK